MPTLQSHIRPPRCTKHLNTKKIRNIRSFIQISELAMNFHKNLLLTSDFWSEEYLKTIFKKK